MQRCTAGGRIRHASNSWTSAELWLHGASMACLHAGSVSGVHAMERTTASMRQLHTLGAAGMPACPSAQSLQLFLYPPPANPAQFNVPLRLGGNSLCQLFEILRVKKYTVFPQSLGGDSHVGADAVVNPSRRWRGRLSHGTFFHCWRLGLRKRRCGVLHSGLGMACKQLLAPSAEDPAPPELQWWWSCSPKMGDRIPAASYACCSTAPTEHLRAAPSAAFFGTIVCIPAFLRCETDMI